MSRNIVVPGQQQMPIAPVMLMNPAIVAAENPFIAKANAAFLAGALWLEPFGYTLTWNTLAASAQGQQASCTIDQGIDFILVQLNLVSYTAAGTVLANPDYLLEMQERSGNSNFTDGQHHVGLWTGQNRNSGARVYNLVFPRYIRGSNTILAKLTNLTATAARVDMGMEGIRITYLNTSRKELFGVEGQQ